MTRQRNLRLLAFSGLFPVIYSSLHIDRSSSLQSTVLAGAAISIPAFLGCKWLIPLVAEYSLKAGLHGKDINKKGTLAGKKLIPESLGLAVGVVYLLSLIAMQQMHIFNALAQCVDQTDWILDFNAALATICFMLFLGFVDDVMDIRWRVKLIMPALASLPLLASYSGGTGISVPIPLRSLLGSFIELGAIYKLYIMVLTIFCTNSINILAGVNGLEAGQTFLIASAISTHNLIELAQNPAANGHLFSLLLMLPLAATTLALLQFNWYPSQVFVGDTFTYFAGMVIAVAGILGHFSETLLIFLIPQIFNFCYSTPQLFGIVPCSRHRLPKLDQITGRLKPAPHWNLVNLTLSLFGPCTEEWLCIRILAMQYLSCILAFTLRWYLKGWYK